MLVSEGKELADGSVDILRIGSDGALRDDLVMEVLMEEMQGASFGFELGRDLRR